MTEVERYEHGRVDLRNPATDSWTDVLSEVADLATKIAGTDFVPDGFRGKVPATAAAILYGREVGFGPMQALASLHSIKGRVAMSAEAMRAKALEAGHDILITESTSARCIVRGRRRGGEDWTTIAWTIDDAKRAGLRGDNWTHYPRQMLQARATAELCRLIFADVIHGLPAVEELEQEGTAAIAPAMSTTKVQRRRRAEPAPPPLEADMSPSTPTPAPDTDQPEIDTETAVQAPQTAEPAPPRAPAEAGGATSGAPPAAPRAVETVKPLDEPATRTQLNKLRALLIAHNGTLSTLVAPIVGHSVQVATALTQPEAELVIGELQAQLERAKEPALPDIDDNGPITPPEEER